MPAALTAATSVDSLRQLPDKAAEREPWNGHHRRGANAHALYGLQHCSHGVCTRVRASRGPTKLLSEQRGP